MEALKLLNRSEMKKIFAGYIQDTSCESQYSICQCSLLTACYGQLCTGGAGGEVGQCLTEVQDAMQYCPAIEASPTCTQY